MSISMNSRVGVDRIAAMARKLGLGVPLDIDVPGERGGLIPTRAWKKEHFDKFWLKGDVSRRDRPRLCPGDAAATRRNDSPRGQWRVCCSAAPDARIRRRGRQSGGPTSFPHTGISERSRKFLLQALDEAVNHPRGTAFKSRIEHPGRVFGGKTGTAQVRRITMLERDAGCAEKP